MNDELRITNYEKGRGSRIEDRGSRDVAVPSSSLTPQASSLKSQVPDPRPLTPDPAASRGISLLEVLISIFILAIGLLSIASLLPVGSYQAQKAGIEDRKAVIGQNAVREFRTRGMADPTKWTKTGAGATVLDASGAVTDTAFLPPVAIDPRVFNDTNTLTGNADFPRGVASPNSMKRVGLTFAIKPALADLVFVSRDDAVFEKQADPDLPAISKYEAGDTRRLTEGNFSWLATLAPAYANSNGITPGNQFNLSIVIFYKRNISVANNESGVGNERQLTLDPVTSAEFGLGGGELTLQGTQTECDVRPGDWIMVSKPSASGVPFYFRWYRIVTVADWQTSNKRDITIAGPDWGSTTMPDKASIFEGAIGVYEKTVHLEGPSLWTN